MLAVKTAHYGPETLAAVCSRLRREHALAAVPVPRGGREVLACGSALPAPLEVAGDGWRAIVTDSGERMLSLEEPEGLRMAGQLVHQSVAAGFEGSREHWRMMDSTRQWYERRPRRTAEGIDMVGRVSFSTVELPGCGVGIAIDRGHMFRTAWSVADFFDPGVSGRERRQRRRRFDDLRDAAGGRKGTLMYRTGKRTQSRCYFVDVAQGATCGSVGPIEVPGETHDSLCDYYRARHPRLGVSEDDSVAYVSFPSGSIRKDVPVAAKLLRLRVMLDKESMPSEFRSETTMGPGLRRAQVLKSWDQLDTTPLRATGLELGPSLWSPDAERTEQLPCPSLEFGGGRVLTGPKAAERDAYRKYYRDRRRLLEQAGVYRFNETGHRELTVVTPGDKRWSSETRDAFVSGLVETTRCLAGRSIAARVVKADGCDAVVEKLAGGGPGMAAIVFDDADPAAYSILAHDLKDWDIKRFRSRQVERSWRSSQQGGDRGHAGKRRWRDMLFHSAIDVLDQMGCTPWRLVDPPYEASVAIDVGAGRRYFGLSLLVSRQGERWPALRRVTKTWPKGDHQHEGINPRMLKLKLVELFAELEDAEPLDSLVVLRDGRECGEEPLGIQGALEELKRKGVLSQAACVDVVDFMKRTVKDLRMWSVGPGGAANVLEGCATYLDESTALVCCTGAGTLSDRGTAEPSLVRAHPGSSVARAVRGVFALAQLNYSSPTRAHRYPLPIRETDEALQERADRDMRGIK